MKTPLFLRTSYKRINLKIINSEYYSSELNYSNIDLNHNIFFIKRKNPIAM